MTAKYIPRFGDSECEALQDQPISTQRILVVEQAADVRQVNAAVLIDAGYEAEVAEDGAGAWAMLQTCHYDLLITDQFLPNVSGVELLKKIHTARMALPIIMATSILPTWEFALHPCLQSIAMLRKPYTFEKLLSMVKNALLTNIAPGGKLGPSPTLNSKPVLHGQ